jgi:hypothetical protein
MPQIQMLEGVPSFGGELGKALGQGVSAGLSKQIESFHKGNAFEKAGLPRALANLDPAIAAQMIKSQQKNALIQQILGGGDQAQQGQQDQIGQQTAMPSEVSPMGPRGVEPRSMSAGTQGPGLTPQQRTAVGAVDPQLGRIYQGEEKLASQKFQQERAYHTQFSAPIEKKVTERREGSRKLDFALDLARDAVESGDVGRFSPSSLASLPGLSEPARRALQSAKGAQLETAGKEFLFSNMGRLSAKAQNIFMEQRIGSMFPQIGKSKEANLTTQEILEGESALDKIYLKTFDNIAEKDMQEFGFVRKDIDRRVDEILKPFDKEILDRTAFRTREIQESEWSTSKLKNESNKKVSKGTYLTPKMGGVLYEKFGDKALDHAKKLGYTIPDLEEYELFQMPSREFRERYE